MRTVKNNAMKIIHAKEFLSFSIAEKLTVMLNEELTDKGQKLLSTTVPDGWMPAQRASHVVSSPQFSGWYSQMVLRENPVRKGGVCHIDGQNEALKSSLKILNKS